MKSKQSEIKDIREFSPMNTHGHTTRFVALFDHPQASYIYGRVDGKLVIPWNGWPVPAFGESWLCETLTEWSSGILIRPIRRVVKV